MIQMLIKDILKEEFVTRSVVHGPASVLTVYVEVGERAKNFLAKRPQITITEGIKPIKSLIRPEAKKEPEPEEKKVEEIEIIDD